MWSEIDARYGVRGRGPVCGVVIWLTNLCSEEY
ncbi:uncharacterized protein METZ01_LOCUS473 [marine metagenome]|uniref:Uncharacterized protein n=1 Tax=marine metagenome TaxID=408172 RepID=A0A381MZH1_9ZZZZ